MNSIPKGIVYMSMVFTSRSKFSRVPIAPFLIFARFLSLISDVLVAL